MRELPIPFTTDMVKAILEGRKTQTRRVIKQSEVDIIEWLCGRCDNKPTTSEDILLSQHKGKLWINSAEYPEEGGVFLKTPYQVVEIIKRLEAITKKY